jgi:hypothetical protein
MIRWTGHAQWEFEFHLQCNLTSIKSLTLLRLPLYCTQDLCQTGHLVSNSASVEARPAGKVDIQLLTVVTFTNVDSGDFHLDGRDVRPPRHRRERA